MGGKQIDLQQQADGEGRGAVQQRTAEQIAEACRAERTGEHMRERLFGCERFGTGQQSFGLVRCPSALADFAGNRVYRVDAAQIHAAQRHVAHKAQRVFRAFALGGENAV